ncbi:hypothetical protein DICVIV_14420 [Dictyocaulus viviparus]|uniref:Uncharacterized protein n=1 Tax=Dictyocaulus viviparus TaxID=29172 RepID=A0A0D8X5A0_DICVI|nr:hypothetical protein DICVIV_14420 [Dictyocaulus viviparus]
MRIQVVVVIQQADGTSTIQSFMAQCIHQRILYNKQTLPHRIEEALEELKLVATKLEQKAPLPQVEMKVRSPLTNSITSIMSYIKMEEVIFIL